MTCNDTTTMVSFVYYKINIGERMTQVTKIKVKKGEDIDSIIHKIKLNETPEFDAVAASSIELFERIDSATPLDSLTQWNMNVTWGKPETPLIVRVVHLGVTPWSNNYEGTSFPYKRERICAKDLTQLHHFREPGT